VSQDAVRSARSLTRQAAVEDSLGEQGQRAAPSARVVRACNTAGDALMVGPDLPEGPATVLLAGNDPDAEHRIGELLRATGWDVADLGGIEAGRWLEAVCTACVAYGARTGTWGHAFELLR
jgi:8-hydroxy-5-deazaflavin:NADPH oxidoreductase